MERWRNFRAESHYPQDTVMGFIGDRTVIDNIILNGKDNSQETNIVAIFPGGGQKGVLQGGFVTAVEKLGIADNFDAYVAVSCGVAEPYYLLGGNAAWGTKIYSEDNVANKLFHMRRFRNIFDGDTLEWVLREEKPINHNYLKSRKPQFYAGVTDASTGEVEYLDVKRLEDPLSAIMASVNIPIVNGGKVVEINDKGYIDGSIADPLPISWSIQNLNPTDILVVLTNPLTQSGSDFTQLAALANFTRIPKGVKEKLKSSSQRYMEELGYLLGTKQLPQGVRIAGIYPQQTALKPQTIDRFKLEQAARVSEDFAIHLFTSTI